MHACEGPQSIEKVLKNSKSIKRIAFDIGQSVVKIAYTATVARKKTTLDKKLIDDEKVALRLYCIQVRLEDIETVLDFIAEFSSIFHYTLVDDVDSYSIRPPCVLFLLRNVYCSDAISGHITCVTWQNFLTLNYFKNSFSLYKVEEMDCLVRGTNFLLRNIEAESFTYDHHNDKCRYLFETIRPSAICPYLLVNVGTDLDEMMRMAEDGDHRQFDLLVSDIYGQKPSNLNLDGDLIAGSFGKCARKSLADELKKCPNFKKNVMRSLLLMISNSIGQFAFMYGQREKTTRIYFNGFLIRNHAIIMRTISFAVEFWSKGTQQAHFLRHEGYTSAIGAYLTGSSLVDYNKSEFGAGRVLELECTEMILGPFPLLAENDDVIKKAVQSQENSSTAVQRIQEFRKKFLEQLAIIRKKPFAYGNSNVRNLLDLREQLLNEQDFDDSYLSQKTIETAAAIENDHQRLFRVTRGLLAGNVFDWGAQKVIEIMESSDGLSFSLALSSIPERPWLIDTYDDFKASLESKPYNCVAIFVDNSGADFVLGVIPFVRELLRRGSKVSFSLTLLHILSFLTTQVIVISNLSPSLNDLTFQEMKDMIPLLGKADEFIGRAIENGNLMFEHNGQGSPCLDLRKVHEGLNRRVIDEQVDLIVIEGMGRALHTNLYAHFLCDSLKHLNCFKTESFEEM
ncbi:putative pantothenate kinase [Dictyocaulus viviparus]|uniref:4'-phosphopantetheine phosphatase n=1 Tax=Dictyocaulus viviparus TaxID=29172 RepID=A0A0D8XSQ0_DICVI|nr:putative pantothenate kinase [Dictyocaulus viviparus]